MGKMKKKSGWVYATLLGIGTSLMIWMAGIALLTGIVLGGRIGEGTGDRLILGLELVALAVGSGMGMKITGITDIRIPVATAIAYVATILICGLLMDGSFGNVWTNILMLLIGCLFSCALCIRKTRRKGKMKRFVW